MSLTQGTGPLGRGGAATNYAFDGPAHRLLFEPYGPRLRALIGGRTVLDSTRAHLLYETGIRPVAYVPLEDVDGDLLRSTATTTHCPFKGDASYWSLQLGERVLEDAVWAYEEPIAASAWLRGFAALDAAVVDTWVVEDEPVLGRPRDPYHRVDVHRSSRPVAVTAGDVTIAASDAPLMLFETSMAPRSYLPRADVPDGVLEPAERRTVCPYKGVASYWHVRVDGRLLPDAAWSYEDPLPESAAIAGAVCFDAEGLLVRL